MMPRFRPDAASDSDAGRRLRAARGAPARSDVLRFITCGSVDDGKSTLIGRLLYDTRQLFDDQLAALEARLAPLRHAAARRSTSRCWSTGSRPSASRASRSTSPIATSRPTRRAFIVADTPGHEQYTRNMATGASTADARDPAGRRPQGPDARRRGGTRCFVSMLGIRHVVRRGQQDGPRRLRRRPSSTRDRRGVPRLRRERSASRTSRHPALGAQRRQRRRARGRGTPWYAGPTLLDLLETVDVGARDGDAALPPAGAMGQPAERRFPRLCRPRRRRRGRGRRRGARAAARAARRGSTRIVTSDGDLAARARRAVGDADARRRGRRLARRRDRRPPRRPARVAERLTARLFWMAEAPLAPGAGCILKLGTATVGAEVVGHRTAIDLDDAGRAVPAGDARRERHRRRRRVALDRPLAHRRLRREPRDRRLHPDRPRERRHRRPRPRPARPRPQAQPETPIMHEPGLLDGLEALRRPCRRAVRHAGPRHPRRRPAGAARRRASGQTTAPQRLLRPDPRALPRPQRGLRRRLEEAKTGETVTIRASHGGSGARPAR